MAKKIVAESPATTPAQKKRGAARPRKDAAVLDQVFGDLERVDATNDVRLIMTEADIANGERGNQFACALARSAERAFGSSNVVIVRTVAYIDLLDESGNRRVERFMLGKAARKVVRDFDTKGQVKPAGIVLSAPTASNKLEERRKYNARRKLYGYEPQRKYQQRVDPLTFIGVRNGTGVWRLGK